MEQRKEAVVGVVVNGTNVLVGRVTPQKEAEMGGIRYVFPGGKVKILDNGSPETAEAAVAREVDEETGYRVIADTLIGERVHPRTSALMKYILCTLVENEPRQEAVPNAEIVEVLWVPVERLTEYMPSLFDEVKTYLEKLN